MPQNDDEKKEKSELEEKEAEERSAPSGTVVYKAIMSEGKEELERSSSALFWSGLAAGMSMGFSLIAEALLRAHLPETRWSQSLGIALDFS